MPRGLNRTDLNTTDVTYKNGTPATKPKDFGNPVNWVKSPNHFGNAQTKTPSPTNFGNVVDWVKSPNHFGNDIE